MINGKANFYFWECRWLYNTVFSRDKPEIGWDKMSIQNRGLSDGVIKTKFGDWLLKMVRFLGSPPHASAVELVK